jgi:hypothetical protein
MQLFRHIWNLGPIIVDDLTTSVAEEHWTFFVSVTVGTRWDLFTRRFDEKAKQMVGRWQ